MITMPPLLVGTAGTDVSVSGTTTPLFHPLQRARPHCRHRRDNRLRQHHRHCRQSLRVHIFVNGGGWTDNRAATIPGGASSFVCDRPVFPPLAPLASFASMSRPIGPPPLGKTAPSSATLELAPLPPPPGLGPSPISPWPSQPLGAPETILRAPSAVGFKRKINPTVTAAAAVAAAGYMAVIPTNGPPKIPDTVDEAAATSHSVGLSAADSTFTVAITTIDDRTLHQEDTTFSSRRSSTA